MASKFAVTIITVGLLAMMPVLSHAQTGDCSQAAARVVAQTGGQLLSVTPADQGGHTICEVTVLVPGQGDARPRKVTVSVPA